MGCGWHHHGPCWDWAPYPYPPQRSAWRPVRDTAEVSGEEIAELREYLRRLESEMTYVRERIERSTDG